MKKINVLFLWLIILLAMLIIPMQSYASNKIIVTVGYAYGGETIVDKESSSSLIRFSSRSKMKAGTGLQSEFGYDAKLTENIGVRYLIGYKYNTVDFRESKHEFLTFPASMLVYYRKNRISFGGGLTYHMNPSYRGTVNESTPGSQDDPVDFDNALGFSALVDFSLSRDNNVMLEIRYTNIKYDSGQVALSTNGPRTQRRESSFDGSNLAIFGIVKF